ncbi:MAG TPA: T9SS type A sorting domain-containing protein [Chitinophagales bacterium]|nr:T9SS type A sorting domain-containing protein [Chitinophagales bacterium]
MKQNSRKDAILLLVLLVIFITDGFAQAGNLDSTFNNDGQVITYPAGNDIAATYSVAVQSDEKIVAVGYYKESMSGYYSVFLTRYNSDGSLDSSFGSLGKSFGSDGEGKSIAIQQDGKIIVGGTSLDGDAILNRFNTDGSFDDSFVLASLISGIYEISSVSIEPDGKIIAAGSNSDFAVIKCMFNGSLDSTFGNNGEVNTSIGIGASAANSVALQSDGKILVAGYSNNGADDDFTLVRYNTNGTLDSSFNNDGILTTDFGSNDQANSIAIQSDGKIVVAGVSDSDFAVIRYSQDGTPDSSFGIDSKLTTAIGISDDEAHSVAIQSDGKIVAAGFSNTSFTVYPHYNFALVRYKIDGTLDNTFGSVGIGITDFYATYGSKAYSVIIQSDGKIVAAGLADNAFAIARYLSGLNVGVLDLSNKNFSTLVYPNPISSQVILQYILKTGECISISLFDMQGNKVQTFINSETRNQGENKEVLDLDEALPSGNYILSISNGVHQQSIKVTVMR